MLYAINRITIIPAVISSLKKSNCIILAILNEGGASIATTMLVIESSITPSPPPDTDRVILTRESVGWEEVMSILHKIDSADDN